jgi:FkbM family methyltransferase
MINISKSDFRTPLGKLLRMPLKLIPGKTVLPILQGPLKGKKWIKGSSINGCLLGTYELEKRVLFSKYVKPGFVVYDVGANVGYYSLLDSVLTGMEGKVFSFEPLPENISYLKKHIELNKIENISVVENAVSNEVTNLRFIATDNRSMSHISNEGEIEIETTSLDEFIKDGNPLPDLIKMDIEGAEYDALLGAKEILKSVKPVIFLATHSNELRAKCIKLLIENGYTITPIDNKPVEESDEFVCVCS